MLYFNLILTSQNIDNGKYKNMINTKNQISHLILIKTNPC